MMTQHVNGEESRKRLKLDHDEGTEFVENEGEVRWQEDATDSEEEEEEDEDDSKSVRSNATYYTYVPVSEPSKIMKNGHEDLDSDTQEHDEEEEDPPPALTPYTIPQDTAPLTT
jgi:hypothetical protein